MGPPIDPPTEPRSVRTRQVLLVVLLMLMGSCGVGNGVSGLRSGSPPEVEEGRTSMGEATVELAEALGQALHAAPLRRVLAAANVVVSLLLPIAAATVLTRRRSLQWWVTQGALANGVWTVLDAGSQIAALLRGRPELLPKIEQELVARRATDPALAEVDAATSAPHVLYGLVGLAVAFGLMRLALYGATLWLARGIPPRE
jgi:hypothetical protein